MGLRVFPQDKLNHYAYGTWIAASAASTTLLFGSTFDQALLAALTAVATAGAFQEWLNHRANKKAGVRVREVSWADFWATVAGAAPVAIPLLILSLKR